MQAHISLKFTWYFRSRTKWKYTRRGILSFILKIHSLCQEEDSEKYITGITLPPSLLLLFIFELSVIYWFCFFFNLWIHIWQISNFSNQERSAAHYENLCTNWLLPLELWDIPKFKRVMVKIPVKKYYFLCFDPFSLNMILEFVNQCWDRGVFNSLPHNKKVDLSKLMATCM